MDNGHFPKVKDSFTWSHYSPFTDTPGWWNNPPSGYHNRKMLYVGVCPFMPNPHGHITPNLFDVYTVALNLGYDGSIYQYKEALT